MNPVRELLWHVKERLVRFLADRGYADSLHVRLRELLRDATLVLDIGANDGQYARLVRRLGFRGRIISFEPLSRNVARLERQAARDGNWQVIACAVGAEDGTIDINVTAEDVFSSALPPTAYASTVFASGSRVVGKQTAPLRRLDTLLRERGVQLRNERTHLKSDTQGFDLQVLIGSGEFLRSVASVQCEVSLVSLYQGQPHWVDVLTWLEREGFALIGLYAVTRDRQRRIIEADAMLARRDETLPDGPG